MSGDEALRLAVYFHVGRRDRLGSPAWRHNERVQRAVAQVTDDPTALAAAALHDVIEVGAGTAEEMTQFDVPPAVVRLVEDITLRPSEAPNLYAFRVLGAGPFAREIKIADLRDRLEPVTAGLLSRSDYHRMKPRWEAALAVLLDGA